MKYTGKWIAIHRERGDMYRLSRVEFYFVTKETEKQLKCTEIKDNHSNAYQRTVNKNEVICFIKEKDVEKFRTKIMNIGNDYSKIRMTLYKEYKKRMRKILPNAKKEEIKG